MEKNKMKKLVNETAKIASWVIDPLGTAISYGVIKVVKNASDLKKFKKENEELKEKLCEAEMNDSQKQKVIEDLNHQLQSVETELREEKEKTDRNKERISLMQEQVEILRETIDIIREMKDK